MTSEPHMNEKNASNDPVWGQAVQWVLRQREDSMDADDWEALTIWLEENPDHGTAYDQALEADEDLGVVGPQIPPEVGGQSDIQAANDNRPWWLGFGAVAAVLIAVVLFWPGQSGRQFATLQTGPGEIREVSIGSAITMTMNGNSKLTVNETDKIVRMIDGEASFAVTSDTPGAIRVELDELVLVDVGTVFNVIRDEDIMRLAVTEGTVAVNPERQKIRVDAGNEISMQLDDLSYTSREISNDAVLAWHQRQLVFENRTIAALTADIERSLGIDISLSEDLAGQRITGTLSLANDQVTVMNDLAAVLGKKVTKENNRWVISN